MGTPLSLEEAYTQAEDFLLEQYPRNYFMLYKSYTFEFERGWILDFGHPLCSEGQPGDHLQEFKGDETRLLVDKYTGRLLEFEYHMHLETLTTWYCNNVEQPDEVILQYFNNYSTTGLTPILTVKQAQDLYYNKITSQYPDEAFFMHPRSNIVFERGWVIFVQYDFGEEYVKYTSGMPVAMVDRFNGRIVELGGYLGSDPKYGPIYDAYHYESDEQLRKRFLDLQAFYPEDYTWEFDEQTGIAGWTRKKIAHDHRAVSRWGDLEF